MIKNRHKSLTLWARARDYECQQAIKEASQRSQFRYQTQQFGTKTIDSSQLIQVHLAR
jgi:hypothetical protein